MVVGAGAAFSDQSKIKNTEAVDACTALNIIGGYPDGSFKPEGNITRAEVTKMICVALNGGKNPAVSTNTTPTFSDVRNNANAAWAEGYIESCAAQGIVSGVGGGKFAPNGNVTGVQLAKMLLVSLGYKSENEGFTGNAWATNVNTIASAKGLYEGLETLDVSAALTRDSAARMIWNALQAYEVEYKTTLVTDSKGQLTSQITVQDKVVGSTNDKITLLRDKYDAWVNVGTLVKVDGKDLTIAMNSADRAASDLVKDANDRDLTSLDFTKLGTDYSALMGQKVKIIFKNGKTNDVLGVYATEDNTVYNTVMNAVEQDGSKIKFDGKSYSVEEIAVYVDGVRLSKANGSITNFGAADFDDDAGDSLFSSAYYWVGSTYTKYTRNIDNRISADEVKFIDSNDNDKIDTAIITTVDVVKATYVSSTEIVAGSNTYKFEEENISKDIKKDDYVAIRKDLYGDCLNIVPAEKLSSAKITGTKTNPNQYLINGTWYVEGKNADMNSAKSGDTVNAYVVNGVAFYAKRASGENSTLSDVAVVLAVGTDIQGDKAKILKMDKTGSTEIVDIDNDPGAGYVAKKDLKEGAVYEYSVKSGEYRFKELSTTKDYFGDYTALGKGAPTVSATVSAPAYEGLAVTGAANADKFIGGTTVDDSAKIILITDYDKSTADYKVITGKQFKSLTVGSSSNNALDKGGIAAFTSKVDGVTRVTYGVVAVKGIADSFVTNDNYGYVTSDTYKIDGGYVVYNIWTGTEEVTVQEKGTDLRVKGDVLGYSSITKEEGLSDGVIGTIEDVDDSFGLVDNGVVYGVNDKQTKVSLNGSDKAEVNSDTVVLYVDTDNHKGYTKGSIVEADDFNNGKIANVMYVLDNPSVYSSDVTLLIVDVKNNLHGDFNVVFNSATTAAADINAALAKGDVTVASLPDSGVVVPAGKTLTVTSAQTYAKVAAVGAEAGAKLVLKQATSDNANGDVFKDKNSASYSGSNVKADTYTASVSSSTVTWTGTLAK